MQYTACDGSMRYARENVEPILNGEKYITARYDFERDFEVGDLIMLETPDGEPFAVVRILMSTRMELFHFVHFVDLVGGHRRYTSTGDAIHHIGQYYDGGIVSSSMMDVFAHELVEVVGDD